MRIYFETGRLSVYESSIPAGEIYIIDAEDGVVNNQRMLDIIDTCKPNAVIYTNSVIALNSEYCWNNNTNQFDVFIRRTSDNMFVPIQQVIYEEFNMGTDLLAEILEYYV